MSNLQLFTFHTQQVRVLTIDQEPWFVAKDLCDVLEIRNVSDTLNKRLDGDEKGIASIYTPGGNQEAAIVSESGMYNLVLSSRKPEAKAFKKWITAEVLPSIRKTGQYQVKQESKDLPQLVESVSDIKEVAQVSKYYYKKGSLQLSQLVDVFLGNQMLSLTDGSRQQGQEVEGAVECALRLGFKVPSNYESSLGKYVKQRCSQYLVGKNNRYSQSSAVQIQANMYPKRHPDVEAAVKEFCLSKALT